MEQCASLIIMSQLHRGAYTTARTVCQNAVFELDAHIERLKTTLELMFGKHDVIKPERIRPVVISTLRAAIVHFRYASTTISSVY